MDLRDLQEAYLEYTLGRFTAEDLAEYKELFYQLCAEYDRNPNDIWEIAYFEKIYLLNELIPYNKEGEWWSPITDIKYKDAFALYPEIDRPGDFILIDNEWHII